MVLEFPPGEREMGLPLPSSTSSSPPSGMGNPHHRHRHRQPANDVDSTRINRCPRQSQGGGNGVRKPTE
eukprot:7462040-Pyramimonas_sp.AAC.1